MDAEIVAEQQELAGTPSEEVVEEKPAKRKKAEKVEEQPMTEEPVIAQEPEVIPSDACSECLGAGLIGDPYVWGNSVCQKCGGKGVK